MAIPAYQKIINALQQGIQKGEFRENDKLPSEAQLMKEFSTSRITVTRALKELELSGVIYRVKGKGSFVSPPQNRNSSASKVISLILPHKVDFFSGGQQYSREISSICRERGYLCSIHYSDQSTRKEKQILLDIMEHDVAGAIIYPISNKNIATLSQLSIQGFPMVMLDRRLDELSLPLVTSDNYSGAYQAVSHLCGTGHKRIAFVGAKDSEVVTRRYKGYCRALTDHGLPLDRELMVTKFSVGDEDRQSTLDETEALDILKRLSELRISAVFCVNDLIAYRLIKAAETLDISIPENLSLVGFDNMPYTADSSWQLTTMAQDFKTIALESVSLLLDIINSEDKRAPASDREVIVPVSLIQGNTTAVKSGT